jgi:hypothetical protein
VEFERFRAAQYSRELSGKVWRGCKYIAEQGYWAGGKPPYGPIPAGDATVCPTTGSLPQGTVRTCPTQTSVQYGGIGGTDYSESSCGERELFCDQADRSLAKQWFWPIRGRFGMFGEGDVVNLRTGETVSMPDDGELLTIKQVVELTGLPHNKIQMLCIADRIPCSRESHERNSRQLPWV